MDGVMQKIADWEDACGGMSGHEAQASDIMRQIARRLRASRYYVHKLVSHKYAVLVLQGVMSEPDACAAYEEAMRNYDGVMQTADSGNSAKAMEDDMANGYGALLEMLEKARQ